MKKYNIKNMKNLNKDEIMETISIIMIGDSSVGKSTLMKKFVSGEFSDCLNPTLGVELCKKELTINDKPILYRIWDTCGQERYRSLCKSYFRNSDGIMLLFNLNSINSFENLSLWLNSIKETGLENMPLIIVGTKSDLESQISEEMIQNFVFGNNLINKYFKCSSKNNIGIDEPFLELANLIIEINNQRKNKTIKNKKIKINKKVKGKKTKKKFC